MRWLQVLGLLAACGACVFLTVNFAYLSQVEGGAAPPDDIDPAPTDAVGIWSEDDTPSLQENHTVATEDSDNDVPASIQEIEVEGASSTSEAPELVRQGSASPFAWGGADDEETDTDAPPAVPPAFYIQAKEIPRWDLRYDPLAGDKTICSLAMYIPGDLGVVKEPAAGPCAFAVPPKHSRQLHRSVEDSRLKKALPRIPPFRSSGTRLLDFEGLSGVSRFPKEHGELQRVADVPYGYLSIQNGCVRASDCIRNSRTTRKAGGGHCLGFNKYSLYNESLCLAAAPFNAFSSSTCAGGAGGKEARREQGAAAFLPVEKYFTFQHFVLDKLAHFLVADSLGLKTVSYASDANMLLMNALGVANTSVIKVNREEPLCFEELLVPVAGAHPAVPRLPHLFDFVSRTVSRRFPLKPHRWNQLVVLERGEASNAQYDVANMDQVAAWAKAVLKERAPLMKVVRIDPSRMKWPGLLRALQRARVLVGVHGGQMANLAFAQVGSAVVEITGRRGDPWKSYFYDGWAASLHWFYVPKMCKVARTAAEVRSGTVQEKFQMAWTVGRQSTCHPEAPVVVQELFEWALVNALEATEPSTRVLHDVD